VLFVLLIQLYRFYTGNRTIFPFGHGLGYTSFAVTLNSDAGCAFDSTSASGCVVNLSVKNTGSVAGDVVITAFFRFVDVASQKESKMLKQLFDFDRLTNVASGESRTVAFGVTPKALAVADIATGDIVVAAGRYALGFEDGGGAHPVEVAIKVTGPDVVLERFPSSSAA
jgi:beta-glucosidase